MPVYKGSYPESMTAAIAAYAPAAHHLHWFDPQTKARIE